MEKISYKVLDTSGKEVGTVDLDSRVFDAPVLPHLVHDTVRWQLARRRSGTHQALTRTMKEGGAKKPYKQKGTGRARAGSSISPLWVGGASVHGPLPRSYDYRLPKRTRRQALASVLSQKRSEDKLIVLDQLGVDSGKTKDFKAVLKKLNLDSGKALFVTDSGMAGETKGAVHSSVRAGRNIGSVEFSPVAGVNVYDLMKSEFLVVTRKAVDELSQRILGMGVLGDA